MARQKNDAWWLLLLLAAGTVFMRPAVSVRATDRSGRPLPDLSGRIAEQAAFEGMTVPEFMAGLDAESRATGVPVSEILRGIGIV